MAVVACLSCGDEIPSSAEACRQCGPSRLTQGTDDALSETSRPPGEYIYRVLHKVALESFDYEDGIQAQAWLKSQREANASDHRVMLIPPDRVIRAIAHLVVYEGRDMARLPNGLFIAPLPPHAALMVEAKALDQVRREVAPQPEGGDWRVIMTTDLTDFRGELSDRSGPDYERHRRFADEWLEMSRSIPYFTLEVPPTHVVWGLSVRPELSYLGGVLTVRPGLRMVRDSRTSITVQRDWSVTVVEPPPDIRASLDEWKAAQTTQWMAEVAAAFPGASLSSVPRPAGYSDPLDIAVWILSALALLAMLGRLLQNL